ncbi:hypothetical protein KJ359_007433 [Pestalotiopsis sp. 9143b]|nr:hypothetical protein KJ359_007433 [Pestalotiopsis sp. 9143b]
MKFAKELEADLVPGEKLSKWRIKYLNYKAGKKYVKAVSRAINKANATPHMGKKADLPPHDTPSYGGTFPTPPERMSLTRSPGNEGNYGSFVPTPPAAPSPLTTMGSRQTFELPAPAMRPPSNASDSLPEPADTSAHTLGRSLMKRSSTMLPLANQPGDSIPTRQKLLRADSSSSRLRRIFSYGQTPLRPESIKLDQGSQALDAVRQREMEFFEFLNTELEKVETFYKQKEEQAGERLAVLRDQLHEMRNRRAEELAEIRRQKEGETGHSPGQGGDGQNDHDKSQNRKGTQGWIDPIKARILSPGPNSKALLKMAQTAQAEVPRATRPDQRDYVRRLTHHEVPYRTAKRKLKLALQEFYRGLELLKSYTLLNRTAFRKLNKKYDKAVNARPPYRFMNEKVNKSWFVNSEALDGHIKSVEDLYARYFEKGNHKIAAGKLRRLTRKPKDESGSTFLTGVFLGTGGVFVVQGLIYGAELLFDEDPVVRQQTSYLMQIYGGYFLILYLFALFCLDCSLWTAYKVNYPFIFELDPRHQLDWRQLAEFPSFCLLLLGLFMWLNFTRYGSPDMYLYYPVILVFLTLFLIFLPAPIIAHRSRKWFVYSHWRLLLAGLYPVEFRDFFLGDMYCSLTYAVCNVELFFCLYAHFWNDPDQCNSSHSRLLGFFSTLPPIWRALQCVRRYADTKNVFPHLVNCGKYAMTITAAVMLSLYRINGSTTTLALFATFSCLNSMYTSIWDLFMDFSFLQPDSRHRFLRDILAFKKRWMYYVIMVIDPILRFNWIFYAIFTHDKQHNSIASFLIGFSEVTRRGMWALFRVENEHCSNVSQYKASRDVPLPYKLDLEPLVERPSEEASSPRTSQEVIATAVDSGMARRTTRPDSQAAAESSPAQEAGESGLRKRRGSDALRSGGGTIRRIMANAHRQDFEKKRRAPEPPKENDQDLGDDGPSDDDDDDDPEDDEDSDDLDERMEVRRAEHLVRGPSDETEQ